MVLRPPKAGDAQALVRYADDPDVVRYTFLPVPYGIHQAHRFIAEARDSFEAADSCLFVVERLDTGEVVGTMGLDPIDEEDLRGDVGYWLGAPHRGQGLAFDALSSLLAFAFDDLGLQRVQARVLPGNDRSIRLLGRHGFEEEGRLRGHVVHRGRRKDELRFGLLRDDWQGGGGVGDRSDG